MLILSRVCADFYDTHRKLLFRITRNDLGLFVDAPESIKQDPLFQMLVNDGSLEAGVTAARKRTLESDPTAGTTAAGQKVKPEVDKPETKPEKAEMKAESKPETKTAAK